MSNNLDTWVTDAIVDIDAAYAAGLKSVKLPVKAEIAKDAASRLQSLGYNAMCYEWFQEPVLAVAGHRAVKVWWTGKP